MLNYFDIRIKSATAPIPYDLVKISACRPLSKTKNFVIVQKIGRERLFTERMEAAEEAKTKSKEKEKEETE